MIFKSVGRDRIQCTLEVVITANYFFHFNTREEKRMGKIN